MLRLLLLRHAKAVQDSGEGDFARPLAPRGRDDAMRMGRALDTHAYIPALVLCSSARRTVETFESLAPELAKPPKADFQKGLYLASPKKIFDAIIAAPADCSSLMVIGHNPGMEELADRLARKPQGKAETKYREAMREKFPTCALAVLDFDARAWSDIQPASAMLTEFLRPKDL